MSDLPEKITHRELCILGSDWLKKALRCTISIYEPKGIKENPDAIGWRYSYGGGYLILISSAKAYLPLPTLTNRRTSLYFLFM